jgi:hypothetical protein
MELAGLASNSLRDDLRILVDQNAHSDSSLPSLARAVIHATGFQAT